MGGGLVQGDRAFAPLPEVGSGKHVEPHVAPGD